MNLQCDSAFDEGKRKKYMMKFQRRILPPHSPTYLEMEEYIAPPVIQPSSKQNKTKQQQQIAFSLF